MNWNLPGGVTLNDIDRHLTDREVDTFVDNYVAHHWYDLILFNKWFNDISDKSGNGTSSLSTPGLTALIDESDIGGDWRTYLEVEAEKDYWEGRINEDQDDG